MLSDRALLIGELLEKSSEIALKYYNSPGTELKPDQSVVTLADKAIEEYLVSRLEDLENDVYVIGEETSESKSLSYIEQALKKKAWIIDPIDGTSMYSARIPIWGISIGHIQIHNVNKAGVVTVLHIVAPVWEFLTCAILIAQNKNISFIHTQELQSGGIKGDAHAHCWIVGIT